LEIPYWGDYFDRVGIYTKIFYDYQISMETAAV
jgi:hypothetical protein